MHKWRRMHKGEENEMFELLCILMTPRSQPRGQKLCKKPALLTFTYYHYFFIKYIIYIFMKTKNVLHFFSAGKCENIIICWFTSWSKIFPFLLVYFNCNFNIYYIYHNQNIYINRLYSINQLFICCLWLNIYNITHLSKYIM